MYRWLRKLLFSVEAESAHRAAMTAGKLAQSTALPLLRAWSRRDTPTLRQTLLGLDFENPVGIAAGLDKNAELVRFWHALGFGYAEVGSVTARPSAGNPRPRAFRLPRDRALVNRMGLGNEGAERVARRLDKTAIPGGFPLGINVAKTHDPNIVGEAAIADYCESIHRLAPYASYLTLNVSCPNTREGKTFEEPEAFDRLLEQAMVTLRELPNPPPMLVKLGPPPPHPQPVPTATDELIEIALSRAVDGFVACNTAGDRIGLETDAKDIEKIGKGGLSGAPLRSRSTRLVAHLFERCGGRLPIIGVGGIASAEDAMAKIAAGASLVQVYTGLVYEGPGLVHRINRGLEQRMAAAGLSTLSELIGSNAAEVLAAASDVSGRLSD